MIPARVVLYLLSFSGFLVSFMMRTDINIAMVAMAKLPSTSDNDVVVTSQCYTMTNASYTENTTVIKPEVCSSPMLRYSIWFFLRIHTACYSRFLEWITMTFFLLTQKRRIFHYTCHWEMICFSLCIYASTCRMLLLTCVEMRNVNIKCAVYCVMCLFSRNQIGISCRVVTGSDQRHQMTTYVR